MNVKLVSEHEYRSKSNPDRKPYIVKVYSDGTMSCNCRGWTMKKVGKPRGCTHTKKVTKELGGTIPEAPVEIVGELVHDKLPVMRPNDGTLEFMENDDTIVQLKYDGTYSFMIKKGQDIMMPGRSFKSDYTKNHPEFVMDARKIMATNCILAGELTFFDKDGKDHFLTALATEETWLEKGYTPKFMVHDVLQYVIDTKDKPLSVRESILDEIFEICDFETFERIESYRTLEEKQHAWEISTEGIIVKKLDSVISDGRTNEWRKIKKLIAEDFWAIGLTKGTGAREVTFGAMMVANKLEDDVYEYIAKTSGFTNEQLVHFLDTLVRNDNLNVIGELPRKLMYLVDPVLVEIKYQRKTEKGSLIMPRFVKERTDIS